MIVSAVREKGKSITPIGKRPRVSGSPENGAATQQPSKTTPLYMPAGGVLPQSPKCETIVPQPELIRSKERHAVRTRILVDEKRMAA